MGRSYEIGLSINNVLPERVEKVKQAATTLWSFEGWNITKQTDDDSFNMYAAGQDTLYGETDDAFAHRLANMVWNANGGFCPINVTVTFIEEAPYEEYFFDEEYYSELTSHE